MCGFPYDLVVKQKPKRAFITISGWKKVENMEYEFFYTKKTVVHFTDLMGDRSSVKEVLSIRITHSKLSKVEIEFEEFRRFCECSIFRFLSWDKDIKVLNEALKEGKELNSALITKQLKEEI